nr:hypothetical protein [Scytonema sp. UIC 10036]
MEDVFRHFQPSVSVQHEDGNGTVVEEEFRFQNLARLYPKTLTQKIPPATKYGAEQYK